MTTLILTTNKKVLLNCDSTNEFTKKLSATQQHINIQHLIHDYVHVLLTNKFLHGVLIFIYNDPEQNNVQHCHTAMSWPQLLSQPNKFYNHNMQ